MYRRTWASSNPTVLTQYPRAQKLRPNNVPLVCNNSRWIRIALLPFRYPIVIAMLYRGGTLSSMWMWSGLALPSTSSIAFWRHNSRRMCPMPRRILPDNTLRRYFGRITTWYLQSHLTWAWLCQSFMAVLPPLEAFLGEDRLTSTSGTAEPIGFAPPEAVESLLIEIPLDFQQARFQLGAYRVAYLVHDALNFTAVVRAVVCLVVTNLLDALQTA